MPQSFPFFSFFIFNLLTSTLFTVSSYSWVGMWTGLEFNLISFIPLLIIRPSPSSTESAVKYFIVQAFSSALLLFSLLVLSFLPFLTQLTFLIIARLRLKIGLAPFHHWVPNIAASISWLNLFLLFRWQKLAPLAILSQFILSPINVKLTAIIRGLSAIVGGLGGLNQTQLRTILAFSSIGHIGWIISCLIISTCVRIFVLNIKLHTYF